jgi:hypothetical protein
MMNAAFAAIALLLQAAPVATTPATAPPAATPSSVSPLTVQGQKKSVAEDNRVVCHREQVLGTMFPKEICATKAQITERRNEDQAELKRETWNRPYVVNH